MDTDPSARRFPPLPPSHPHPLPPPPPSISPAIARHGSRSDSGSSTDGSTSVNSHRSEHVGQPSARPHAHFYGQNPYNTPPQRRQNPNATVDVSNTPHHSTRPSQASQATQNHPTNPNVHLAAQFPDYQARSPPSLTSAASRPTPYRSGSGDSSPSTGSVGSQESSHSSRFHRTSDFSASPDPDRSNDRSEQTQEHMSEGTPPLNYNPEHYPAFSVYDTTRRIGFDPIYRQAELLHLERGDGHYRARTLEYPPEGVSSVPLGDPAHGAHVSVFPASPLAPLQPLSHPSPQPAAARDDAQMLEARTSRSSPSLPTGSQSDASASPAAESGPIVVDLPESATDIRRRLGLDPDEEISLYALGDPPPGEKPNYQYTLLIQLAILGSPSKRLTLREILAALEDRFEWFRDGAGDAWKRSIRHLLSLNKCFRKVPKPITEPGKGHYWVVDYSQGEGNKRPRKRNKRPTKAEQARLAREQSIVQRREEEEESGSSDEEDARGASFVEDANIDPQLRNQGHVVGERRLRAGPATRSSTRRGHSPYTTGSSQGSPARAPLRMTPTPTPVPVPVSAPAAPRGPVFGQTTFGQPTFGQPTFGQSTFGQPTFGQPTFGQPTFGQPTFGQPTPLGQSTAASTRIPSAQNAQYMAAAGLMAMNTPPAPPVGRERIQRLAQRAGVDQASVRTRAASQRQFVQGSSRAGQGAARSPTGSSSSSSSSRD